MMVPANAFPLTARVDGSGGVLLRWPDQQTGRVRVGYAIFRESEDGLVCRLRRHGAADCLFYANPTFHTIDPVGLTGARAFRDDPGRGRWVYRVAVRAGPLGQPARGDFVLLSESVDVDVPR